MARIAGFVYHMFSTSYYLLPGRLFEVFLLENQCFVLQIDVCYGADLMIMESTLDTRCELLHQCLAEDSGPAAVDSAAEATPACS